MEAKIIKEGNYSPSNHNASSIVNINGIAPTVMENHGTVTAIKEPNVFTPKRTELGKAVRKEYEKGNIKMSRKEMTQMELRTDGISNTLTSVQKDNYLAIPEATKQEVVVNENWKSVVGNKQMNPFRGSIDGESPCITSDCGAGGGMTPMITDADIEATKSKEFIEQMRGHEKMQYRIRKLTPRECYRLMGVDDADIDKIQAAGISNAQQYKMAGNSIVVDVLYYLFKQMFVESENNQKGQLTLF